VHLEQAIKEVPDGDYGVRTGSGRTAVALTATQQEVLHHSRMKTTKEGQVQLGPSKQLS